MGTHRTPPLILLTILSALLAAPLVLIHAPYRPLYPLVLVCAAAVWISGGLTLRIALLVVAAGFGPVLWRLMQEGGAAEAAGVLAATGVEGAYVYLREFVLDGAPRLSWVLLPCVVLLGFAVAALARRVLAPWSTRGVEDWRASATRRIAFVLLALIALALAVPRLRVQQWEARNAWGLARRAGEEDARFLARVHSGVAALDRAPIAGRRDVDVVLYVGESSSRWNWSLYGYPRATNAPLARAATGNRFVAFSAAVTPMSAAHTPPPEGLSSLAFLFRFRRTGESVVPLVHVLSRAGVSTLWLSNARKPWRYDSVLTGPRQANGIWRDDGDLVPPLRDALREQGSRLVVLDTYAGHFPWCAGVPSAQQFAWDDWMARLSNVAIWGHAAPYRAALDCYDSAMRYTSAALADAMRVVDEASRPTMLIFVPNRGDDAWAQAGRFGDSRSARQTDVPLLVYANAAYAQRYPEALENARRNRDQPVVSEWVYDAVLDAFGLAASAGSEGDSRLSVLNASYDPRAADSATLATTGVAGALAQRARLDAQSGGRFCTHRGNSLFKFLEGKAEWDCVEMDVVLDASARGDGPAYVYHPPVANPGLPLYELLANAGVPRHGLWLDVKNLTERNATPFLARLSAIVPAAQRGGVLIETSNLALARSPMERALADSGFVTSYYLPTELGCTCARSLGGDCAREIARLSMELRGSTFRGLSFDARGRALARTLRADLTPQPVLNTWTPMDRCPDGARAAPLPDAARDSLLAEVQKYLVKMPTAFDY
jgi:glucan phosphoethanolaminetransferase (alkaline phosphatase superfamily)